MAGNFGGARPGAGKKKGTLWESTIEKRAIKDYILRRVKEELDPLLDAQMDVAKGHYYIREVIGGVEKVYKKSPDPTAMKLLLQYAIGNPEQENPTDTVTPIFNIVVFADNDPVKRITATIVPHGDNDPVQLDTGTASAGSVAESGEVQSIVLASPRTEDYVSDQRTDPSRGSDSGDVLVRCTDFGTSKENSVEGAGNAGKVLSSEYLGETK